MAGILFYWWWSTSGKNNHDTKYLCYLFDIFDSEKEPNTYKHSEKFYGWWSDFVSIDNTSTTFLEAIL